MSTNWQRDAIAAVVVLLAAATGLRANPPYETAMQNGPSANRVDIVFVGDGYRQVDIDSGLYAGHVQAMVDHTFSNSLDAYFFGRYQQFFNVYRVNVVSVDNGADKGDYGTTRNTALNSTYYYDGTTERLLYLNTTKANNAVNTALAGTGIVADMKVATVNDTKYGGGGGAWAVYAGGNSSALEVALHEVAHSFTGVADEYYYTDPPYNQPYTGSEPSDVNVTKSSTTHKWERWENYVDPRTSIGPIGYYEGGQHYQYGIYRPSNNSKMRSLYRPFDAITREAFIKSIYDDVDPLDSYLSNAVTLQNPDSLWVDTIDPDVIGVTWFVDDVAMGSGETFTLDSLHLAPGLHTIRAFAYDEILTHSFTSDSLDWWRLSDTSPLTQSVSWQVEGVPEPALGFVLLLVPILGRRRAWQS